MTEDECNIFGKLLPQNLTAPHKQHLGKGLGKWEDPQFSLLQTLGGSRFPGLFPSRNGKHQWM